MGQGGSRWRELGRPGSGADILGRGPWMGGCGKGGVSRGRTASHGAGILLRWAMWKIGLNIHRRVWEELGIGTLSK